MLHNGVFTLDERLQHEKLGRKRDFCGAKIFNNGLFRPAKKSIMDIYGSSKNQ